MNISTIKNPFAFFMRSRLFRSSFWGIAASGIQTILLSLFFVIMARQYSTEDFALFLVASNIYQFLAAFSTLGLGQWFTREIVHAEDKDELVNKFMKMQVFSGVFFYAVCIGGAYGAYSSDVIRNLSMVLGANIIFDNIIYAIKALNVAEFKQEKTFVISLIDSVLKFLAACVLFVYPISLFTLSFILIVLRFITLNIFLVFGSSNNINLRKLLMYKISFSEVKKIVLPNWAFLVIGSISMIYWRIGNFIISKKLDLPDVANYEVSFKIYSLALVLPIIVSTTVFPSLVELRRHASAEKFTRYFQKVFYVYFIYSLLVYTFFYSFSDQLIPYVFGEQYINNPPYTKEMFLSVLIFPTALLQANVLVAMHKEKSDMWLNFLSLVINVVLSLVGLMFWKSLSVINFAIFGSILAFHIGQDVMLYRYRIVKKGHIFGFYLLIAAAVIMYQSLSVYVNPYLLFVAFWLVTFIVIIQTTIKFSGLVKFLKNPTDFSLSD